jgi:hypothetical protein
MSQLLQRGSFAQAAPQIAPISLGQYGLPNILQMLLQPQGQSPDEEDENPLNPSDQDPFALLGGGGRNGGGGGPFDFLRMFERQGW